MGDAGRRARNHVRLLEERERIGRGGGRLGSGTGNWPAANFSGRTTGPAAREKWGKDSRVWTQEKKQ
ncbi:hypothetical protein KFK09_000348 [Dendrobium nobile]|uniref:Uncharacterized protein n=1 Tax=Dendrobium nobile TaxID=94219 RepID=A0A8T3CEH3_DENNO|nr:hypothetical protein KFK09_000348 [Dendrobium nobile]